MHPVCNFIKRETSSQVLFSEFGKILNTIFFIEHLRTTAPSTNTFYYPRAFIKTMSSCFNSLFYKLLLFWTIFKLQIGLWTFKRVLWSQNTTYTFCIHCNDMTLIFLEWYLFRSDRLQCCAKLMINWTMPWIAKYFARILPMQNISQNTVSAMHAGYIFIFLKFNIIRAIFRLFFSTFFQPFFHGAWFITFMLYLFIKGLIFDIHCGFFPLSSWFNATVAAYWKHLSSSSIRFLFAFLFFIQSGEPLCDPTCFRFFYDIYNPSNLHNQR